MKKFVIKYLLKFSDWRARKALEIVKEISAREGWGLVIRETETYPVVQQTTLDFHIPTYIVYQALRSRSKPHQLVIGLMFRESWKSVDHLMDEASLPYDSRFLSFYQRALFVFHYNVGNWASVGAYAVRFNDQLAHQRLAI